MVALVGSLDANDKVSPGSLFSAAAKGVFSYFQNVTGVNSALQVDHELIQPRSRKAKTLVGNEVAYFNGGYGMVTDRVSLDIKEDFGFEDRKTPEFKVNMRSSAPKLH